MPTTSLSKTQFEHELDALARLQEKVVAILRPVVDAYLNFAKEYRRLYTRVAADHQRVEALRTRLGITDYQHQRFMAIAESSTTLSGFKRALPPAVEPLYEIARLAKDGKGEKRLRAAVKRHELTPTSGIREIRGIRNSMRRQPAKPVPPVTTKSRQLTTFEFVFESDDVLRWNEVEAFNTELMALLAKHKLRSAGLRDEKTLQQHIETYWTVKDGAGEQSQQTKERAELERLRAAYYTQLTKHDERIRRVAEKAIQKLMWTEYQRLVRAEFPPLSGRSFPNIGARRRAAELRTKWKEEDIRGGVLSLEESQGINSEHDVKRYLEAAEQATPTDSDVPDLPDLSILVQADNMGVIGGLNGGAAVANCIARARHSVKESPRLRKAADALERAQTAYGQRHPEEVNADEKSDDARVREITDRLFANRRRRRLRKPT